MKKIGIMAFFYNSSNYGGLLQAYALTTFLNKYDNVCAEQICYEVIRNDSQIRENRTIGRIVRAFYHLPGRVNYLMRVRMLSPFFEKRSLKMMEWRKRVSQSDDSFVKTTIKDSVNDYDGFITGSDQVWNLRWSDSSYFLDFVPNNKKKYSYGASIGSKEISPELSSMLRQYVSTFDGITVREESTAQLVSEICNRDVKMVLDPTLLLERNDWDEVCSGRLVNQKYVFCYFLGNDEAMRHVSRKIANRMQCVLVNIPHAPLDYKKCDEKFGDIDLYDVDPSDFISLIRFAEYIITDSFHASVFSNIYSKKFIAFGRKGMPGMNNRIIDLCKIFGNSYRFLSYADEENLDVIISRLRNNKKNDYSLYENIRKDSVNYISYIVDEVKTDNYMRDE